MLISANFLPKALQLSIVVGSTLLLCACGPKDIGQELADDVEEAHLSTAEQMRYPHFGSDANQRRLFFNNQMHIMEQRQHIIAAPLHAPNGLSPASPRYREIPKEQSPFRQ
ncbi:MAG: hypothetical protein IJU79_04170 [Desulfovibrionaceae bacterium]|nr:hypothetical protein [Desulfovibrionaceae bacterium]